MSERFRRIRRDEWRNFHDVTYARQRILLWGVRTEAQVMHIGRADAPVKVPSRGGRVTIADSGWDWLQLAPADGHWWMTAMYGPEGRAVQYYFDITAGNRVGEGKDAEFEDLYLDYVLHPDGGIDELDRDELEAALRTGAISRRQYADALEAGDWLKTRLNGDAIAEINGIFARLRAMEACAWEDL